MGKKTGRRRGGEVEPRVDRARGGIFFDDDGDCEDENRRSRVTNRRERGLCEKTVRAKAMGV